MLWRYAERLDPLVRRTYQLLVQPPVPNLKGDRDLEYSWVAAKLPPPPGRVLDFGCGHSWMGLFAARKGFEVTAIDRVPIHWPYQYPNLQFLQGDLFGISAPKDYFDVIINCSSIEHVGLANRYDISQARENGDLEAMALLRSALKPEGKMILTIPVGQDTVYPGLHRVYGRERLLLLLDGWSVLEREFWAKNRENAWEQVSEHSAMGRASSPHCYALGLLVVERPD
jgi:SAM-dependent methyltransferase